MMGEEPDFDRLFKDMTQVSGGHDYLKMNEIQYLMISIFDWRRTYAQGFTPMKNRTFHIILACLENKKGIKSLQEFFDGKRVSRFANNIDDWNVNKYLGYVMEELQRMMDPRIVPSRIK